jgi:hypothetical protein
MGRSTSAGSQRSPCRKGAHDQAAFVLVSEPAPTIAAATRLLQRDAALLGDHTLLHPGEDRLGVNDRQPERRRRQVVTFNNRNLDHLTTRLLTGRGVVGFYPDLDDETHERTSNM